MQPTLLIALPTILLFATWDAFIGAIPYGIKYGILASVFCLASILIKELALGKPGGSMRMSINKYILSFIFSTSLTWVAGTFMGASIDLCYVIAGATGLTIEWTPAWVQTQAFARIRKIFKS